MLAGELLARYYNVIIDIILRYYGIVCMDEACIIMCVKVSMEILPHAHCGRGVLIYCCSVATYLFPLRDRIYSR